MCLGSWLTTVNLERYASAYNYAGNNNTRHIFRYIYFQIDNIPLDTCYCTAGYCDILYHFESSWSLTLL